MQVAFYVPDNQRYGIKSVPECLSQCHKKELVLRFGYSFNAERAFCHSIKHVSCDGIAFNAMLKRLFRIIKKAFL